ncbi:MAG TPA: hypothetical protein VNW50_14225 [Streptosporangiaceae bacterium]|jgi:hypothetical protein|nr:hypothetical protein [Streptosporangiaceae bacterium]
MDSGHQGHRLSRHLPPLPDDVADRIIRALAAESGSRSDAQSSGSAAQVAVPPQRSAAGQSLASYVPRQRRADDPA